MHDIQLFLTVRIKDTGRLAEIGNFFLAPTRWLFSGKTVIVHNDLSENASQILNAEDHASASSNTTKKSEEDEKSIGTGIAEVSSYSNYREVSRFHPELKSTYTPPGDYGDIISVPFFLILVIPGIILGSICKWISYYKNPDAQKKHEFVKKMLTPKKETIDCHLDSQSVESELKETNHSENNQNLFEKLRRISMSGQHINDLIISGDMALTTQCEEEIRAIKPSKLILNGVKAKATQFQLSDWDNRALHHVPDYSGLENDFESDSEFKAQTKIRCQFVNSTTNLSTALSDAPLSLFFHPATKPKTPTIVSSIEETKKSDHTQPHTVYVIEKKEAQGRIKFS